MDRIRFSGLMPNTTIQNQPTSTADSPSDEPMAEADEPPDERQRQLQHEETVPATEFKKVPCTLLRKQSLLTQTFHTSESESQVDDEPLFSNSTRAHSSASTWSRGSVASTAELTSDEHTSPARTGSPSPPLPPATFKGLPPIFNQKPFEATAPSTVKVVQESIDPLRTSTPASTNEEAVEKGLGRKRCIMFACGGKTTPPSAQTLPKPEDEPPKQDQPKSEGPPTRRPCALKFVCPSRANVTPTTADKPHIRLASPPPPVRRMPASPKPSSPKMSRSHRSSDSTVRNDSPKSVRKVPSVLRTRKSSSVAEVPMSEATRFHEFASSEEERDDWTQEVSCHRHRLTVQDTLKVENKLRHVCEEAEDEAMEEEEDEEDGLDAIDDEEDLDDEDDDDDNQSLVDSTGYVTDEGFHTDDEEGFANSDEESDAGSDYEWWAPRNSGQQLEHIRPATRRSESGSSIGSFSSTRVFPSKTPKALKKSKTNPIEFRPRTPELPDSTDFVCGTLDEDKPLEEAWLSCRNQRRAANHRPCPQDIDPTFPTSDPELDEEDEAGYEDVVHLDESDGHSHFFVHGHPDLMSDIDAREPRSRVPKKRSPAVSPKRLRSPPPIKRAVLHSPPPRRLFGHSPKRMRSPPPRRVLRSPPPSRRTSFTNTAPYDINATPVALAQRPRFGREASSLPRNGPFPLRRGDYFNSPMASNSDEGEETQTDALPTRGAIDIVKGLEKKRQRRKEKLYEKHCRMRNKSKNAAKGPVLLPGMGAEKMRQMGEGLCKMRGHGIKRATEMEMVFGRQQEEGGTHILSY
ncbi:uncharacterized protein PV09_06062 [Verruconis gallopava]|uniref:Extensin domain-containing protein n=1 Tax=Verruconis gallopava TaxID=253628 RepID=A0A0D2A7S8_9PEZI|nr:uncharacterized protein PV09_06062 [Verruconis gallopava]KIW02615.1 hypothetical protein PV09_06062 [Verruconis gallopava]